MEDKMKLQVDCERMEHFLVKNIHNNACKLTPEEFHSLNKILLELEVDGYYTSKEKRD